MGTHVASFCLLRALKPRLVQTTLKVCFKKLTYDRSYLTREDTTTAISSKFIQEIILTPWFITVELQWELSTR